MLEGGPQECRHLLERLVLQQPGEQQVAGLQQGDVFVVLHLAGGQQPGRLEVQQGGGDDQELAGLIQRPVLAQLLQTLRMYLMNSSVTVAMATSVMSSWCLEIRPSRRSNGPVKLASRTSKPGFSRRAPVRCRRPVGHGPG